MTPAVAARRSLLGLLSVASLVVGCEQLAGIEDLHGRPKDVAANERDAAPQDTDPEGMDAGTIGEIDKVLVEAGTISPMLAFPRHIALGSTHSCVIEAAGAAGAEAAGRVLCWGSGANGQLGKGAKPTSADAIPVPGIEHAKSIAAGAAHTCAIDEQGAVLCWGRGDQGQLGGKPSELGAIVRVNTKGERARQVSAGALHTCVLLEKSGVRCWGDNAFGQLGDGTRAAPSVSGSLVAPVGLDGSIVAVFAGGFFSCALKKNGAVSCWGDNTFGQIGDRTKNTRLSPVAVADLAPQLREIALGQNAACVVIAGGSLQCWGRNRPLGEAAQHGIVNPFPPSPTDLSSPATVGADAGVALLHSVALSANHACARSLSGHALCWGSNSKLQLGVAGDPAQPTTPTIGFHDVAELAGVVKEIAVGFTHSCALAIDDDVYCWGGNEYAQLGTPAGASRAKPERVASARPNATKTGSK